MSREKLFENEAALVEAFVAWAEADGWVAYAETAGWDVLLVRKVDGFQIGVEAKMSLNAKVLCQVLDKDYAYGRGEGPDCVAVLVPHADCVLGFPQIAARLGIVVLRGSERHRWEVKAKGKFTFEPRLPVDKHVWHENELDGRSWVERAPDRRCSLPDYVPDVGGGKAAPVALTGWKIKAIKIAVLLERRGYLTRADFKALRIDARRFVDHWLDVVDEKERGDRRRFVAGEFYPNFKAQHPRNYEEIEADYEKWRPKAGET